MGASADREASQHAAERPHAYTDATGKEEAPAGAEVVVVEEWLNPMAALNTAIKPDKKDGKKSSSLLGNGAACSTWLCLKPTKG